jgi:hypothetical protein
MHSPQGLEFTENAPTEVPTFHGFLWGGQL